MKEMIPVDLPGGGLRTDRGSAECCHDNSTNIPDISALRTNKTYLSNVRFTSRPRALATLLDSGFGLGAGSTVGEGAGSDSLVTAGVSWALAVSPGVDSVGGAEIRALI